MVATTKSHRGSSRRLMGHEIAAETSSKANGSKSFAQQSSLDRLMMSNKQQNGTDGKSFNVDDWKTLNVDDWKTCIVDDWQQRSRMSVMDTPKRMPDVKRLNVNHFQRKPRLTKTDTSSRKLSSDGKSSSSGGRQGSRQSRQRKLSSEGKTYNVDSWESHTQAMPYDRCGTMSNLFGSWRREEKVPRYVMFCTDDDRTAISSEVSCAIKPVQTHPSPPRPGANCTSAVADIMFCFHDTGKGTIGKTAPIIPFQIKEEVRDRTADTFDALDPSSSVVDIRRTDYDAVLDGYKDEVMDKIIQYDIDFRRQHGRLPKKHEKKPVQHLYEIYEALEREEAKKSSESKAATRGSKESSKESSERSKGSKAYKKQSSKRSERSNQSSSKAKGGKSGSSKSGRKLPFSKIKGF